MTAPKDILVLMLKGKTIKELSLDAPVSDCIQGSS
jgi:hypothetical protein